LPSFREDLKIALRMSDSCDLRVACGMCASADTTDRDRSGDHEQRREDGVEDATLTLMVRNGDEAVHNFLWLLRQRRGTSLVRPPSQIRIE
jgi:hypothetical protein